MGHLLEEMADAQLCVNTLRCFCADMVQRANSGHPGAPMGMAPMAHVLWTQVMNYSPSNPNWYNRDRFVLSNGHGCALLYALLNWTGFEQFPEEQIKNFRQLGSNTPGHPESHFEGIEVTTGPLGQGLTNAVGLAMAQEHLAAVYNREGFELFSNFTYVFCGDGCLMEGITSEAASLAGHLRLGRLIVLYDDNEISIDGSTNLAFSEDVGQRFVSYGWQVLTVGNGDSDFEGIAKAIEEAKQESSRPTLIKVRTTIGFGSSKQGTEKTHGSPLGAEDLANVKKKFGFDPEVSFYYPDSVREVYGKMKEIGQNKEASWNELFENYKQKFAKEAEEITRRFSGQLPADWKDSLPKYAPGDKDLATRQCSQECLAKLVPLLPELVGGSADLAPSNLTLVGQQDFQHGNYQGRNIRFGVREHAMAAVVNGFACYGGFVPYGATFLNFLSYCQGAVTLSALANLKCFFIMTHDSIGLGEDGPTHQPIEKISTVRAMPNILLFRPADGNETSGSYGCMLDQSNRPSVFALSRQGLPQLEGSSPEKVAQGGYVLQDCEGTPDIIIVSTGSEVSICVEARNLLSDLKVRIVSMPCWELFDEQPSEYALSVFPDGVPVLSVEAASTFGWSRFAHASIGVDTAGMSGKFADVYKHFGLYPENIANKAKQVVEFYKNQPPQSR